MNKAELVAKLSEKTGGSKKEAAEYLNSFIEIVEESLSKEEKIQLVGFGTFGVRDRKAREGRNPQNPDEVIQIPATKAPVFKAGKALKEKVNG